MAVFSRLGPSSGTGWQSATNPTEQQGEIKFCILGLMLSTDSPKLLILSVTCGILSIGLLSTASRALITALWNKSRNWLVNQLRDPQPAPVNMGQVQSGVLPRPRTLILDTSSNASDGDLMASYEIVDVPRLRPRMKDAQTSPICMVMRDIGVGETEAGRCERGCSPCPIIESGSPEELLMFEKEMEEGSLVSLDEDGSGEAGELYEKLASIQKALQEANQEMDNTMSSLSELSQRHYCSASSGPHPPAPFPPLVHTRFPFRPPEPSLYRPPESYQIRSLQLSSLDPANGLVWEDEFSGNTPRDTLALWESELGFYSGLCGDHRTETDESAVFSDESTGNSRTARDSGIMELWDVEAEKSDDGQENGSVCSKCSGNLENSESVKRPLSAPSNTGAGAGSCGDMGLSSSASCLSSGCSPLHQADRVPKQKIRK